MAHEIWQHLRWEWDGGSIQGTSLVNWVKQILERLNQEQMHKQHALYGLYGMEEIMRFIEHRMVRIF